MSKKYTDVKEYMNDFPEEIRNKLLELEQIILSVIPDAEASINYNIPAYSLVTAGKRDQQIMIAGYKQHVGLYPHPSTMTHFKDRLKRYKSGKGSVQFPLNEPLPTVLIEEMITYRKSLLN